MTVLLDTFWFLFLHSLAFPLIEFNLTWTVFLPECLVSIFEIFNSFRGLELFWALVWVSGSEFPNWGIFRHVFAILFILDIFPANLFHICISMWVFMLGRCQIRFDLASWALGSWVCIFEQLIGDLPSGLGIWNIFFIVMDFLAMDPLVQGIAPLLEPLLWVTCF